MKELPRFWRFMRSRSGRGFLLHLTVCAALAIAVGCGFYYFSLNWFKEHKSNEKIIALQNQHLSELCQAYPKRFSAFASLALQYPDLAVQQLEAAIKLPGIRGAAIGGSVAGVD